MARLLDENDLSKSTPTSPMIQQGPRDFIGPALVSAGREVQSASNSLAASARAEAKRKKAEGDALDISAATADFNTRILTEADQYDLTKKPDYGKWGTEIDKNLPKHQQAAAARIRDPIERQKFIDRTSDDVTRTSLGVKDRAKTYDDGKRQAEGLAAIDQQLALAARPGLDPAESSRIIKEARTSLDNMAVTGLLTPEQTVNARQKFAHNYASLKVGQDIEDNPGLADKHLKGGAGVGYFSKLRGQENASGSDTAGPDTSSAQGRYQFTKGTWEHLRQQHPDLGLTADGRTSGAQQEVAIKAFTADNADTLKANKLPVTEANLYMMHFMGAGDGPLMLRANPSLIAADQFPKAAKSNPTVFYNKDGQPRTIAQVIALQTRRFDGNSGPAPEYYAMLEPNERARLTSAAESEFARQDKETKESTALDRFNMDNQIDSDVAQIEHTGQPTILSAESVYGALGDVGTAKWLERRKTAAETYAATAPVPSMTNDEQEEHLQALEPVVGSENYDSKLKIYNATEAKVNKLQELRIKDPAKSVEDSPVVKEAMKSYDSEKPESVQGVVRARLAAQQTVEIPSAMQQPITRNEARRIIAPIQSILDTMDATVVAALGEGKGDAAARRMAAKNVTKEAENQIRSTVDQIEATYGPYSQKVLAFAIAESVRDKEIGNIAAVMFRKIAKGEKVTQGDAKDVEHVNEASLAEKGMNGELAVPGPAASGATALIMPPIDLTVAGVKKGLEWLGAKGKEYPAPSQRAVDMLIANPQSATEFEGVFGPGSAKEWLPRY